MGEKKKKKKGEGKRESHARVTRLARTPGNNGRVTRAWIQRNTGCEHIYTRIYMHGGGHRTYAGRMDGRTNEWETVTPNCPSLCGGQVR